MMRKTLATLTLALLLLTTCGVAAESISATVVRVRDGDTLTVDIAGVPAVFGKAIGVRIAGIDTPELKDKRPEIRVLALKARDRVLVLVGGPGGKVLIVSPHRDKFFRVLGAVQVGTVDVGKTLIVEGLARPYKGRGPKPW